MTTEQLYKIFERHPVVTTDSRDCPAGSIFFALKGESFNGNKFAAAALQQGCAFAVVDEAEYCVQGDERYILVDNVLRAFQLLARHHRRTLGTRIVGITGTNGKTTTKELLWAISTTILVFPRPFYVSNPSTKWPLWRWERVILATLKRWLSWLNPTSHSSPT